jgi:hypothetical protein
VAILVATAAMWLALLTAVIVLFLTVFIPLVQFGGKGEIPSDFPVYPGAHLESATASGFGDCTRVDASWSTPDGVTAVAGFYRQELATGAWTVTGSQPRPGQLDLYFRSTTGLRRGGSVSVQSQPYSSTTLIALQMYKSTTRSASNCSLPTVPA